MSALRDLDRARDVVLMAEVQEEARQVEEWYLIVYADAFEWVELPNTHGMALSADGGLLGSKPYAASRAYVNRMSDPLRRLPL